MHDQGTDAWKQARLGKCTASKIADVMAKTSKGYAATRANYASQLIIERLTGLPTEGFCSAAMAWGTEQEPFARAAYEQHKLCAVAQTGFHDHPTIAMAGASPDGLVGEDGLIEAKCPNTATHIETLLNGAIPDKYIKQMQFQMAVMGRQWCDFVSFDPRLPESMRLFVKRVERDDALIAEIEAEVSAFLTEIDDTVGKLLAAYEPQAEKEAA